MLQWKSSAENTGVIISPRVVVVLPAGTISAMADLNHWALNSASESLEKDVNCTGSSESETSLSTKLQARSASSAQMCLFAGSPSMQSPRQPRQTSKKNVFDRKRGNAAARSTKTPVFRPVIRSRC